MTDEQLPVPPGEVLRAVRARTPARILVGRSGPAYRTATWLELRRDHAAAVDAVRAELDVVRDFGAEFVARWRLFEVTTEAGSREVYLLRPDLGRRLSGPAQAAIVRECPAGADVQVVIGDGLSTVAVRAQVPRLLPLLDAEARARGLRPGRPFVVRRCRVGVLNDVGELLDPAVVVLLIGERPGLATAESLSAYLAYRPRPGDTDARRNVIANIHARGVSPEEAARRVVALAGRLLRQQASGVAVKEEPAAAGSACRTFSPQVSCRQSDPVLTQEPAMTKPTPQPINPAEVRDRALAVVKADRFPFLATVAGDQPCLRPVSPVRTDGFTVYVANLRSYHKTEEIAANPKVELGYLDDNHDQVRLTGVAEVVTDRALLQEIWDANPLLRQYLGSLDNPELVLYRIRPTRVRFMQEWALEYRNVPLDSPNPP